MEGRLHPSDLWPGLLIADDVELGEDLQIGANVVIHPGVVLGDGCQVQDGAVLGKRPLLGPRSTSRSGAELGQLVLEASVGVCTGAVLYAGSRIGAGAVIGDQVQLRERCSLGEGTVLGRGTGLENDVAIGARCSVQGSCYLSAHTALEDDVFLGPGVVTANDDSMARHGPDQPLRGVVLRRACRVGAAAVLVPGVEVGEEAYVAAGAVVIRDVPARAVVMGVPARMVREVPEDDLLERWR